MKKAKKAAKKAVAEVPPPAPQSLPRLPPTGPRAEQWIHKRTDSGVGTVAGPRVSPPPAPLPPPPPPPPPPQPQPQPQPQPLQSPPAVLESEQVSSKVTLTEQVPAPKEPPQPSWTSPYTKAPVTLHFGEEKIAYLVPPHFLPSKWTESGAKESFYFPDVDVKTGHTVVHYLYKEKYETPATDDESWIDLSKAKLRAALLVFIATSKYDLSGLQSLAVRQISASSVALNISQVLSVVDASFSSLSADSWVHEHLFNEAKIAFGLNPTVFTDNEFLRDLKNAELIKFMTRSVVTLYNARLSELTDAARELLRERETRELRSRSLSPEPESPALDEVPTGDVSNVDEQPEEDCCEPAVEDAVLSDFSTISCPPAPESPVCVVESDPYDPMAEESCETAQEAPDIASPEVCKEPAEAWPEEESPPTPPEPVPEPEPGSESESDIPAQPISYESAAELVEEVPAPQATECESVVPECEADAPECEQPAIAVEDEPADRPTCPRRVRHIIKGNGWKDCLRCRAVVEGLARQVS